MALRGPSLEMTQELHGVTLIWASPCGSDLICRRQTHVSAPSSRPCLRPLTRALPQIYKFDESKKGDNQT